MTDDRLIGEAPFWGQFWLAENPTVRVQGQLNLRGRWPTVVLAGGLTPTMVELGRDGDTVRWGPAPDFGPQTMHGRLVHPSMRVTLVRARAAGRQTVLFGGIDRQTFEAEYAILGSHLDGPQVGFVRARAELHRLAEWVCFPTLEAAGDDTGKAITVTYTRPAPVSAATTAPAGLLTFSASAPWPDPRAGGVELRPRTWVTLTPTDALTVDQILAQFVTPLSVLLTLLHGDGCPPTRLEVSQDEGGESWLSVVHPALGDPVGEREVDPLLDLASFGCEAVARWIDHTDDLSPLPDIVAAAITHADRAVENILLELATVAEGFHHRLYPDARQLSDDDVAAGIAALSAPDFPSSVGAVLSNALRQYLWKLSYPKRLRDLVRSASVVIPGVTGSTGRWVNAVVDARNGFAHGAGRRPLATDEIVRHHVLGESLRWLLTALLIQQAGVDNVTLAEAFHNYRPFVRFLRDARENYPRVYGTTADR